MHETSSYAVRTVAGVVIAVAAVLASATYRLTATKALGRQLLLRIAARTPSVRAVTVGTVRLPRVAPR